MWARRKPKNRRLGREHVLDVKLRSSQVRAARLRLAAMALAVVFATVLGAYSLWRAGGWALDRLVYQNKAFAITHIDIQTDGVIAVDQLRRWIGVRVGDNLLALDLARVKRDLELVSLVKCASVERILPRTLRIRVTEREPLAQINTFRPRPSGGIETAVFQLDEEGYVIVPLDPRQRAPSAGGPADPLPTIVGLRAADIQTGRTNASPQVQDAVQLLAAFEKSDMTGLVDIKSVDVSSPDVLVATTDQGSVITFGVTELDRQLRRWQCINDLGHKMNKVIATLDLAVSNNIPACWLEASALPPARPKSPKHLRRKHV